MSNRIEKDYGYKGGTGAVADGGSVFHSFTIMLCLFIALALLSGCTLAPFGALAQNAVDSAIERGVEDRMHYNDQKRELLVKLPCDISIGAFYRIENPVHQEALTMLCKNGDFSLEAEE